MAQVTFNFPANRFFVSDTSRNYANVINTIPDSLTFGSGSTTLVGLQTFDNGDGTYETELIVDARLSAEFEQNGTIRLTGTSTDSTPVSVDHTLDMSDAGAYQAGSLVYTFNNAASEAWWDALEGIAEGNLAVVAVFDDGQTTDTTAPTFQSAATNAAGDEITLTYNEALDTAHVPGTGDYAVTVGGATRSVSNVSVTGSTVVLELSSAVSDGETVTVAYTQPTTAANRIQDAAGNQSASLTAQSVTNNVPSATPTLTVGAATVNDASPTTGDTVTFTCGQITTNQGGTPTQQWQLFDGTNWGNISGETGNTYQRRETSATAITVRCQVQLGSLTANSASVTATWSAPAVTAPGPVLNLASSAQSPNTITWGWDRPNTGGAAGTYEYRLATGSAAFSGNWITTGANTSVQVTGLNPSTSYRIQVRSRNSAGTSAARTNTQSTAAPLAQLPIAVAGTVTIASVTSVQAGLSVALVATTTGGTFDARAFTWVVVSGGGTISGSGPSVVYNAPAGGAGTTPNVRCTVEFSGTGTTARSGTTASANDTESFDIVARDGGGGEADDFGDWIQEPAVRAFGEQGIAGAGGEDGSGIEFIFAKTTGTTPANPDNGWGFDTPGIGSYIGAGNEAIFSRGGSTIPDNQLPIDSWGVGAGGNAGNRRWLTSIPSGSNQLWIATRVRRAGASWEAPTQLTLRGSASSVWFDAAPDLSAGEFLWMAQRRTEGFPQVGQEVADQWTSPRSISREGMDGNDGIDGIDGTDGEDGVGREFIFTSSTDGARITAVASLPLGTWNYDDANLPITRGTGAGQYIYYDGTPANLSDTRPFLIRFNRPISGAPAADTDIGDVGWTQEDSVRIVGPKGDKGEPGDGSTTRVAPTIFRLRLNATQTAIWTARVPPAGSEITNTTIVGLLNDISSVGGGPVDNDWVQITGTSGFGNPVWVTYDADTSRWIRSTYDFLAVRSLQAIDISALTGSFNDLSVTGTIAARYIDADEITVNLANVTGILTAQLILMLMLGTGRVYGMEIILLKYNKHIKYNSRFIAIRYDCNAGQT